MVDISGTTISMTRGDTARITIYIESADGTEYIPQDGDRVRFAMKKNYGDAEPLLLINVPIDTMELVIEPSDTKPLSFGSYKYDIELTRADGTVDTFITKATMNITEEVY